MNSSLTAFASIYLLVGLALGLAVTNAIDHKNDSFFSKLVLFVTMLFLWFPALLFPIRRKVDVIERHDLGNPIGNFNLTAEDAPVYPEGSFAEGTSKLTVLDFDKK